MIASLIALATASLGPLSFELIVEKKSANTSRAEVYVTNTTQSVMVLAKPIFDGCPAANCLVSIKDNGVYLFTYGNTSSPAIQVMVGYHVTADRFKKLKPGERYRIAFEEFDGYYLSQRPGIYEKSDLTEANRRLFGPGTYDVEATYRFTRQGHDFSFGGPKEKLTFGPGAKSLWDQAWSGKVTLKDKFAVQ